MKKLEKLKNEILNLCIIVAMITTMMPFYVVDTHGELLQPYTVYVNGSTGSDISGDGSFAKPYKSFEKSQQKAIDNKTVDQDILIKVTGGITVASNATWTGSTSYKTTLQRDSSFTGLLLSIAGSAGKLTVSNITFDGNNMNALGSLLMVNANGTASDKRLVLDVDNCEFINNRDMIFATADEGCNIAPYGKVLVAYGSNQEFNIDAYSGYEIDYVLIDGVNVGAITDYLFTNVYENHTIHVSTKLTDEPILQENKIINNTTNKNELNSKNISAKKSSSIVYKIKDFVKQSEEKTWGLINLIITCLSALLSIILLLSKDSENKFKSKLIYKVLSILITIGLTIYFVSTQNMSYTMKLYDNFTGVMVLFISVNLLCVYFYRKHNQKTK